MTPALDEIRCVLHNQDAMGAALSGASASKCFTTSSWWLCLAIFSSKVNAAIDTLFRCRPIHGIHLYVNPNLLTPTTNRRVKLHLMITASRWHGSPAELKIETRISTQSLCFKSTTPKVPKLNSKVHRRQIYPCAKN